MTGQWQAIETAPKDGTSVLLFCSHGMYVACWGDCDIDWWSVTDNKHGPYPLRGASPTHWQALPPAPGVAQAPDARDAEIEQLRKRVAELEERLDDERINAIEHAWSQD